MAGKLEQVARLLEKTMSQKSSVVTKLQEAYKEADVLRENMIASAGKATNQEERTRLRLADIRHSHEASLETLRNELVEQHTAAVQEHEEQYAALAADALNRREDLQAKHVASLEAKDAALATLETAYTTHEQNAVVLQQKMDEKCQEYEQQIESLDQKLQKAVAEQKETSEKDNQRLLRSRAEHDNRLQAMLEQRATCKREVDEIEIDRDRLNEALQEQEAINKKLTTQLSVDKDRFSKFEVEMQKSKQSEIDLLVVCMCAPLRLLFYDSVCLSKR